MSTFTPFEEKMESAGVPAAAVKAFSRCYEALVSNHSGMIPEMDIQPADQVEDWQDITASTPAADKDLISQCVCIKLNGGLGTSMGLQKAKSLLADGVKYAFVSNSDNLGAQLDMNFLRWFAESGAPFVMEVTRRTEADKKGGHLAVRKADGHLILREVAQCPDADIPEFQNISKHRYFNTNTLWIRLDALKEILDANGGVLPLPMIRNSKTLNPRDPESAPVYQLETAMGAGIECFPGARAVNVPRSRFFPVKTTSDLLLLRSDAIAVDEDGKVALAPEREGKTPVVDLDSKLYKLVDSLDSLGLPSLIGLDKLTLRGRFHFQDGAVLQGTLLMENDSEETKEILPGVYAGA